MSVVSPEPDLKPEVEITLTSSHETGPKDFSLPRLSEVTITPARPKNVQGPMLENIFAVIELP